MQWMFSALGFVLIAVGLHDVFHTLLHPTGQGRVGRSIINLVWRVSQALGPKALSLAGPLALVGVTLLWAALQTVGWALVYYPHVPGGFVYVAGLDEARYGNFAESLYFSLSTLTTVGYGDVIVSDPWIRLLSPVEALIGFGLLTAAVTWFMQVYPALARRRALAVRLTVLGEADYASHLGARDTGAAAWTLETLAIDVVQIRIDLTQSPESFYFRESTSAISLGVSLTQALNLSTRAADSQDPGVRVSGLVLRKALEDLAGVLATDFRLPGSAPEEVFQQFAAAHLHEH
ncbi:hypothetical protein BJG92_02317 [Arthrobacter sp. SO5]|uniref:potassium channel family protein n=1 Tax=Arthrobacter sp. SO5 TaxID=1897055 RepID=UPI001E4A2C10|nr:potassium channel family protein [Arthrobacter sp. SO5]MCB5274780.1 hypothetical protein [Arthrobacter sp. SO5]